MNVSAVHGACEPAGIAMLSIHKRGALLGQHVGELIRVVGLADGDDHVARVPVGHGHLAVDEDLVVLVRVEGGDVRLGRP